MSNTSDSINIDEFKATKDTKGKMAFLIVNNSTGKTFDIINSRKFHDLFEYFMRFHNAIIITDKFHIVALASSSLKSTKIKIMKKNDKHYNKHKYYWKLLQMSEDDLIIKVSFILIISKKKSLDLILFSFLSILTLN